MTVQYRIYGQPRAWVKLSGEGVVTLDEVLMAVESILADPAFAPGMDAICDLCGVEDFQGRRDDVVKLADLNTRLRSKSGKGRTALVAAKDHTYGVCRMWLAYAEAKSDMQVSVFRDVESATKWIGV